MANQTPGSRPPHDRRARLVRISRTRQRPPRPFVEIGRLELAPGEQVHLNGGTVLELDTLLGYVWRNQHRSPDRIVLTFPDINRIAAAVLSSGAATAVESPAPAPMPMTPTWSRECCVGAVINEHDMGLLVPLVVTDYAEEGVLIAEAAA